ncbi:MAG: DNA polymerase II large subunit [Methanobacteriota archaeon]
MVDGGISNSIAASPMMQAYFTRLQQEIDACYAVAELARKKGLDPECTVEIPQALDLAARVEQLVGPKDIAPKIRAATKKLGNRELVSIEIAREIAKGTTYQFSKVEQALDQAIRTGLAILTEGVLVAPLEGIADVKLGRNKDGSSYVDLFFSGPIRSAGGTGQAMSVLIADIVRRELNIGGYQPTFGEIERYKEEIPLYKRVQHLQYLPTVDEIELVVKNCPICINGEGTEDEEVTGYRDLPRAGTNRLRGGACLVIAEGLCLKAPKIHKHIKKLKLKGWEFLETFVNKGTTQEQQIGDIPQIPPSSKYIGEVIAGRPVLSHPSKKGGFRLRYGRARTGGLASTAINPATMYIVDSFITVGTQMKIERPGKGTIGTPCDQIEGPIVLLENNDLVQINNIQDLKGEVKRIIDLGEILIPYGEFMENNALLPDSSYVYEWWIQDLQKAVSCLPKTYTMNDIVQADEQTQKTINDTFQREITLIEPTQKDAFLLSEKYQIPLHPHYNLFWHDLQRTDIVTLAQYIKERGTITNDETNQPKLSLPFNQHIKDILIELGALHTQREETLLIDRYAYPLIRCSGLDITDNTIIETSRYPLLTTNNEENPVTLVSQLAGIPINARAPFRIGARMGRPEKAAARKMRPPPHVLFPLGNYGGNQRLFRTAAEKTEIEIEAGDRHCPTCGKRTYKVTCACGTHTLTSNGRIKTHTINLTEELQRAKQALKERDLPETIKGVIGTISKNKTPEPLEKGLLRAKHNVYVFKDGTSRFDMTDAPLTHFKPHELGVSLKRIKELGYTNDYLGNELEHDDQICELRVQDVIVAKSCAEYFVQISRFIDDLLMKYYKMDAFYKIKTLEDLTGHLVVGLAPHTSAGALGRIIGFTNAQVCFSHPFYHAAKRRNCLSPETRIHVLDSGKPAMLPLQEIYNRTSSSERVVDDFGTTAKQVSNLRTFAFNPLTGKTEIKKITSVMKTRAPHHLVHVTLQSGRSFVSSPAHRMVVWSEDAAVTKKIIQVTKDDKLLVSQNIAVPENDVVEIDLLSEFFQTGLYDDLVVRGVHDLVQQCIKQAGGLQAISQKLQLNKKTFSDYLYRDSIPLTILFQVLDLCGQNRESIPRDCFLGVKRDDTRIPRFIPVNEAFMRLLGYYLAEGHTRYTTKNCYQVGFAVTEKEIRADIVDCIHEVFHVHAYVDDHGIAMSSRLIHDFFSRILCVGKNAKTKRVPCRFTALPLYKIRGLLRAYFAGDGSVEKNRLHVTCCSVDRDLLQDIGFQLLRFGIFYRIREEHKPAGGLAKTFYEKKHQTRVFELFTLDIRSSFARVFAQQIGFALRRKQQALESVLMKERKPRVGRVGDYVLDAVKEIHPVYVDSGYVYDVEVEDLHNFLINDALLSKNCDGDEDGQMLLMDALLNFSHAYIPDKRGGRMDLPLILTTRLDPAEVDKEAHNIDTLSRYPLALYEASLKHEHPKNLESVMGLVSSRIGTELQFEQFGFTHDTFDVSAGPKESLYKTLKTMMEKMNTQLTLAAKLRPVDEADVAYKVIERHFLPDILGNLRAFSKQSVRCPTCNVTFRRIPLQGVCSQCEGRLTLTVHEMSVKKYLNISKEIALKYHLPEYACQRIALVEKSIDSLFMSDRVKVTKLSDFF